MAPTQLRLVDGVTELVIWRGGRPLRRDVIVKKLAVSSPDVREVVRDRVEDDGVDDDTLWHGAGAVSLELALFDAPQARLAELKRFTRLGARPYLCMTDSEWTGERRVRLRADQWTNDLPWEGLGRWLHVQLQWKAPDGVWTATDPGSLAMLGAGGVSAGRKYGAKHPRVYAATSGLGQLVHTNPGDHDAHQIVRMYGPCAGPRYTNDDTGETLAFTDQLFLGAGEYVEVDTKNRTAYLLSDPNASRLQYMDFANSTWWKLRPGANRVRYHPISQVDAGCSASVSYFPTFSL